MGLSLPYNTYTMFALPLPYVSALLLLVLLARLLFAPKRDALAVLFVALSALMMLSVGLRWSFPQQPLFLLALAMLSSLQAPMAWFCFYSTRQAACANVTWHYGLVLLATPCIAALFFAGITYWYWIEILLVALYAGYGMALLLFGLGWHTRLDTVRLSHIPTIQNAAVWAGALLLLNALIETLVALDFVWYGGRHAAALVSITQVLVLAPLTYSIVQAGSLFTNPPKLLLDHATPVVVAKSADDSNTDDSSKGDANIVQQLTQFMHSQEAFRDPDLTLMKLARQSGIPSRMLSGAVNRHCRINIAQWINQFRIEAAQQQLRNTDAHIGDIMLDCGFYTKSNFNQAFRRQTGLTPRAYRQQAKTATT